MKNTLPGKGVITKPLRREIIFVTNHDDIFVAVSGNIVEKCCSLTQIEQRRTLQVNQIK